MQVELPRSFVGTKEMFICKLDRGRESLLLGGHLKSYYILRLKVMVTSVVVQIKKYLSDSKLETKKKASFNRNLRNTFPKFIQVHFTS
jgi:hypothetical protein